VSGLQVVRFVRHLVRPPSVVVVHLRRLRARVLLSSDCVRGVAASGVLARVRRAWLVVDGVGELVLDRGGGSSVARSPPVDGRGGEPQVPQAASFPSVVSDREYIVVDVSPMYSRAPQVTAGVYLRVLCGRGNGSPRVTAVATRGRVHHSYSKIHRSVVGASSFPLPLAEIDRYSLAPRELS
jgi:hypothetical protein